MILERRRNAWKIATGRPLAKNGGGWVRLPPARTAKLHILVLNYCGRPVLERCLPEILRAALAVRRGARVSVIDNGSTDDSCDFVYNEFPEVGLYRGPNCGLSSFNNVARTLGEPVTACCNNDILPEPLAFDRLLETLFRHPTAFAVGPTVLSAHTNEYEGCAARLQFRRGLMHTHLCGQPRTAAIKFAPSAGVVIVAWRHKLLELGGFSGVYFPGRFEDLELCWRAWRAGWPVLVDGRARVLHLGSYTFQRRYARPRLRCLDLRNALICTLRNVRSPRRLVAAVGWSMLRAAHALFKGTPAEAHALFDGLRLGLFSANRWPLALRRVKEDKVFETLRAA